MNGAESADLLNRLSTNRISGKQTGDVVQTLLTSEKGRIIDAVFAIHQSGGLLLIVSPGHTQIVLDWLQKYTIMEEIVYADLSSEYSVIEAFGFDEEEYTIQTPHLAMEREFGGQTVTAFRHSCIWGAGEVYIVREEYKDRLLTMAEERQLPSIDRVYSEAEFHLWRIRNGYPLPGYELSELVNPLESGASALVDFEKGCYIGQEVIARLDSYDKVQRTLKRLIFKEVVPENFAPGTPLEKDGKTAGFLTSLVIDPEHGVSVGLGCIRHAHAAEGTELILHSEHSNYLCSVH